MSEQSRLDILSHQRPAEKRIVHHVDLAHRELVRCPPPCIEHPELLSGPTVPRRRSGDSRSERLSSHRCSNRRRGRCRRGSRSRGVHTNSLWCGWATVRSLCAHQAGRTVGCGYLLSTAGSTSLKLRVVERDNRVTETVDMKPPGDSLEDDLRAFLGVRLDHWTPLATGWSTGDLGSPTPS